MVVPFISCRDGCEKCDQKDDCSIYNRPSNKPYGCYKCGKAVSSEDVRKIYGKTYCPEHAGIGYEDALTQKTPDMAHQDSVLLDKIKQLSADLLEMQSPDSSDLWYAIGRLDQLVADFEGKVKV